MSMNVLQNRIESYQNSLVKWPHTGKQFHKPEAFAKAGFYFVRRPKYSDSVRCFMCDVELSHWRPGQSPFARHTKESPTCAWKWLNYPDANAKPLVVNKKDSATEPRGPTMRTARLASFGNHNFWPPNKSMLNKRKYPSGAKLADAGFFFSPISTQASRIKCPYCRITIAEPVINENILDTHQKLSSNCAFFALAPNMRTTRSRRDTIDSTKTHDTFTTAQSHLQDDESSVETKKPTIKRKTSNDLSKSQSNQNNQNKSKRQRTVSKEEAGDSLNASVDSLIDPEPIKIVKRKKSNDLSTINHAPSTAIFRRREVKGSTKQTKTFASNIDSVWDIENAFSLPSISRPSAATFGKSSTRRTLTSSKRDESSINIFANLKPSLIIKHYENVNNNIPASTPKIDTPVSKNESTTEEVIAVVRPVTEKFIKNRPNRKPIPTVVIESHDDTKVTKKRSLSTSTSSSNQPNKHLRLKVVVDTKPESSTQIQSSNDIPINIESVKKVFKDKGKGREVEYNLAPPSLQKKKLSLSRSKNKQSNIPSQLSSFGSSLENNNTSSSSDNQYQHSTIESNTTAKEVELFPVIKIKKYKVPEGFIVNSRNSSESCSPLLQSTVQSPVHKNSVSPILQRIVSPVLQRSVLPMHQGADDLPVLDELSQTLVREQLSPSPVYEQLLQSPIREQTPVYEQSPVYEQLSLSPVYQSSIHEQLSLSPVYQSPIHEHLSQSPVNQPPVREEAVHSPVRQRSFSPLPLQVNSGLSPSLMFVQTPSPLLSANKSPILSLQSDFVAGPISSPPRSIVSNMSFMQSTPSMTTNNRLVSGFDIFGGNPLSPIVPMSRPDDFNNLQHTPIICQNSRTRSMIVTGEDGQPRIKGRSSPPLDNVLDIEKIFPDAPMAEEIREMKVADFIQDLVDTNIKKIEQHGLDKIKMIQDSSDRLRSALRFSAGLEDQEE